MGCIYIQTCIPLQKSYVGYTKRNVEQRKKEHFGKNGPRLLKDDVENYGKDAFAFDILEDGIIPEFLPEREKYWIAKLDTFHNGYNLTTGGGSSTAVSEETRQRLSASLKGKSKPEGFGEKVSKALKGNPLTEERKENIRLSKLGKPAPNKGIPHLAETCEKISLANKGRKLNLSKEQRETWSRIRRGRIAWNRGVPAYNRSPFFVPAQDLFFSLPCDMETSEKRKILHREFSDVHRKRINHWVRKWSESPPHTPKYPERFEAKKIYESLPFDMNIREKREILRNKFPNIPSKTIWVWAKKWQSETN